MASTMSAIEHRGWQIESRSYEADGNHWCPRALVSRLDGARLCTHDVRALLSVTFDTAQDPDDYSVRQATTWVEHRDYRPPACSLSFAITASATRRRRLRGDAESAPVEATARSSG